MGTLHGPGPQRRPPAFVRREEHGTGNASMALAESVLTRIRSSKTQHLCIPQAPKMVRAYLAAELVHKGQVPVLVGEHREDAEAIYRDLTFLLGTNDQEAKDQGILFLGVEEKSPYEEYSPDSATTMERINTLYRLAKEPSAVKALVVTPFALCRLHVPPSYFDRFSDYLLAGEEIDRDALLRHLTATGYNPVSVVEDPGTFSVRGGIIDIFSPHQSRPLRVDLFGDEIESIHFFDPGSQRNKEKLEDAIILPAKEIAFDDEVAEQAKNTILGLAEENLIPTRRINAMVEDIENHLHFFGIECLLPLFHHQGLSPLQTYLPTQDAVYLVSELAHITEQSETIATDGQAAYDRAVASHQVALPPERHLSPAEPFLTNLAQNTATIEFPEIELSGQEKVPLRCQTTSEIRSEILRATQGADKGEDVLHPIVHRLKRWRSDRLTTIIVCNSRGQAERLIKLLEPKGVGVRLRQKAFSLQAFSEAKQDARAGGLRDASVHAWLSLGEISGGLELPDEHLVFVTEEEIFGQRKKRRKKRSSPAGDFVSDLRDLESGDYVVHVDYGIGQYHGLTRLAINGVESDYLNIEYRGHDKLYLPVHSLRLIQRYATAGEGKAPALSKLGAQTWLNTKRKIKDSLLKIAAALLRLYAARESIEGFALLAPDESFRQFEAEFPFEATKDQAKAIEDVLADLQKASPMDRLVCGDVGYGKTEVAMRAAMLAVLSKKQVAVLAPTTVLAAQHYNVFSERFQNFPITVGIVSRFQTRDEIKETLKRAKEGQIDIIVGTHRLLSKDAAFKDIGLLVIDEEHRFGVNHKERLKKYRTTVHVLSMSATPIPRTLHMGFMGVRDMSLITTAPEDRLSVKTEVHKFGEEVIRDAILREIKRGGQCFVVHNRVASIDAFARFLKRLIPEARITVGHGQMQEDQLEKVMVGFMNREYNVLLCTTIIESGIDIPNANTIVINRADRMGLAQLYQLRGRVGRSKVRGFAHFLIPAGNLSKQARKRIAVLQRFTELGAGFKVASKDLEIRGAGNILGKQQSGTIAQVGFDMYQNLLAEAIAELQGSGQRALKEPEINLPVTALIPDNYVKDPKERLAFYQRFNRADTDGSTYDLLQELTELYGIPPAQTETLADLMLVKQRLVRLGILGLDFGAKTKSMPPRIVLRFDPDGSELSPKQLVDFVQARPQERKLTPDGRLMIHLQPFEDPREILHKTQDYLNTLLRLRRPDAPS